jgi:sugar phosphate isomerase/epimerase
MRTEKYKKGIFLYLLKDKGRLKEQINFINSLKDINHVEVSIEENLTQSELKILKSYLKKYEIIIHAPWIDLNLASPHPEIREITVRLYLKTLRVADILKAKLVTFHCGGSTIYESKETTLETVIRNLKKIKSLYKGRATFTVENVSAVPKGPQISYPGFPKDLIYLKKRIPWLNFTLDIGHVFKGGKNLRSISNFLKKYKNSILDIHLHDAILKGEDHLALGKGNLDFNKFFQILNKIDYTGYISLETISNEDTKKSWEKIYKL